MILIDKYAYNNSLRHVNPKIKASIGAIFLIISMLVYNKFILILNITLMSLSIVCLAKIDIRGYLKLIRIPLYFLFIGISINLINIATTPEKMIYSFKILNLYIGTSLESIDTSIYILLRSISCLTCVYFLVLTTPFNDILFLLKTLHLPDTVIELSMLIYRFIFIFLEEVTEIKKSQELRFGYTNLKNSYKSLGILVNMLFQRMMKRYEDMCISLDIKLYDGKFHIVGDEHV